MFRFSIFGIPVEVQPFFWLTLVILGASGNPDSAREIFKIVLFVLAGFISILVHELGHALTARSFGANVRIVLQAFGGYAAYSGARMTRAQSFIITAAGPAVQIVLGAMALALYLRVPMPNEQGHYFVETLMFISFFWAVLNLLPVLPLDGGQMLNALMGPGRIKITLWISILVAVSGAVAVFAFTGSFIFPVFLCMFAWQAFQALKEHH